MLLHLHPFALVSPHERCVNVMFARLCLRSVRSGRRRRSGAGAAGAAAAAAGGSGSLTARQRAKLEAAAIAAAAEEEGEEPGAGAGAGDDELAEAAFAEELTALPMGKKQKVLTGDQLVKKQEAAHRRKLLVQKQAEETMVRAAARLGSVLLYSALCCAALRLVCKHLSGLCAMCGG